MSIIISITFIIILLSQSSSYYLNHHLIISIIILLFQSSSYYLYHHLIISLSSSYQKNTLVILIISIVLIINIICNYRKEYYYPCNTKKRTIIVHKSGDHRIAFTSYINLLKMKKKNCFPLKLL